MKRKQLTFIGWSAAVAAIALLAGSYIAGQQRPAPQTGASAAAQPRSPRPAPAYQPLLDAERRVREEAFVPGLPLSEADRVYASIEARKMKALVNEVVAISRRSRDDGNKYWGRIAGTKYEAMTGDWVESK